MVRRIMAVCLLASFVVACSDKPEKDAAIVQIEKFIGERNIDKTKAGWKRNLPMPPKLAFTKEKKYFWLLRTDLGNMKLEFMPEVAPMHVSSTIYLSTLGFYDNLN
ncbi:MAG: peptidylprolyl isomerase, partial [Kangiellaceae bacterium]|nr:peptidylprolyl isomerase [Kangiellaceae bacterium]